MNTHDLHDGWTVAAVAGPVPADLVGRRVRTHVPGTSHTALLDAGLIPDPYLDRHEETLAWMRRTDWVFERDLHLAAPAPDERVDLVLDGVDTVATITLDGHELGRTANMHRSYRFDVRDLVRPVTQRLRVAFRSALEHAEEEAARLGSRPSPYPQPYNMVRKMACSFGWDWGPDLQTAGLWRPVRVERWRVARLARVRPLVTVDGEGTGVVAVHVDVERSGLAGSDVPLVVRARVAGAESTTTLHAGSSSGVVTVEVPHAPLWWPVGHGAQPLSELTVALVDPDSDRVSALDMWTRRIGFRTVELDTTPDDDGTPFTFRVNGRPIFVKGANWIPDDHLLTRITRERLARRIDQAVDAHLNLLRVWGGGIYESEDFYELCDERGVLVWQDFLLACAAYPEEQPVWDELEAEAREQVARLTPHPSLVLWNGGNENLWGFMDWGWPELLDGRTWGLRYATELLRDLVAEVDPTRPYSDGSPYSPGFAFDDVHPNDPDHGTHHQWEVWNRVDWTVYRDEVPRFCSEFGFQAPPTWATLTRAVHPVAGGELTKEDPAFLLHQKADDGNGKLDRGLAPHLGVPDDFADWHWATQLNQARAVQFAIEHYRSWWPRTAGAIVWQLNDCWPVTSWAAVDGDERPKPLWYALTHAYRPRTLTVQPRDGRLMLAVVNDTAAIWQGTVHVSRQQLDGTVLHSVDLGLAVGAWSVGLFALPDGVAVADDTTTEALVARLGDVTTVHTWAEDVDLLLDPAPLRATVSPEQDGYRVDVRATSLARGVTLLVDRLDPAAVVDDAVVDIPAGSTVSFHVRTEGRFDPEALTRHPVLRSANDVVVPRVPTSPSAGAARDLTDSPR
ncbi:glycoside hydrolase family 2 TIM barrel-domain containing protein [Cellulomonas sp.]|uniref:glycoside hydrolase family 2 protein n=1 Tax=Cellulomonas sp. TaxID=40001 RepID=UPI001B0DA2E3|nr:glycoside hydrolase family 2 TIM barrel-domain containing protein [Cellulomonas sp.]MBO9553900.1 glycoside hydrolase family 2 protein [Cellulomonas sp.]